MATPFAQAQFGKPIDSITSENLIDYFSVERDESLTLEFKSFVQRENDFKHKENGVLRTVCGFLNSNGGLLIWGAPEGSKNSEGQKVFTGAPSPVDRRLTKDDFIGKISNRIIPFAASILFHRIELEADQYVYLIDVPESEAKPHQFDDKYHIRLDGQTRVAPHYLIDAMFKQVKIPTLSGYLRITSYRFNTGNALTRNTIHLGFRVSISNESQVINDTGVYVQIIASVGRFVPNNQDNYLFEGGIAFVKDASPVITYALVTECSFDYEVNSDEYVKFFRDEELLEVSVVFGSHKSVTRRSDYYIRFKDVRVSNIANQTYTRVNDLNSLLTIEKKENISMNEVQQNFRSQGNRIELGGI